MQSPSSSRPRIVLIAAVAEKNRVIGRGMDLPWHLPEDLKRFKRLTTGHPLVMGRRTFESLLAQFGGPLPHRQNVVLSRSATFPAYPDVAVFRSAEEALAALHDEPMIYIGGGEGVYRHFLPRADRLELTLVEGDFEGDTYFPPYEHLIGSTFVQTAEEPHDGFRFVTYDRRA